MKKKINILGHEYIVKYKKKLFYQGKKKKGEALGICDHTNHIIYLKTGMPTTERNETFLHECIHAIENINDIDLTENQVRLLAIGIHQIIRDNKIRF